MQRNVFFSFHFEADCWRASQVRNIGVVNGNHPISDNGWEKVKRGGDGAVKNWIASELKGRSCTVVLVGSHTAERSWISYEILESWRQGKAVVGIRVHDLKDRNGRTCEAGKCPFESLTIDRIRLRNIVSLHNPWHLFLSPYEVIKRDIGAWIEQAIQTRQKYSKSRYRKI
jgi:hypothetical protein